MDHETPLALETPHHIVELIVMSISLVVNIYIHRGDKMQKASKEEKKSRINLEEHIYSNESTLGKHIFTPFMISKQDNLTLISPSVTTVNIFC